MKSFKSKKQITPLPYPYYFFSVASIAFGGFVDSIYLSISHYRVYVDVGYQSFCAISLAINCDTVSQSSYSIFLGLPVPVWGVFGYAVFIFLLSFAWQREASKKRIWSLLFLLSFCFSAYSIYLATISLLVIRSYCIMCVVIYAVNFLLLFLVWLVRRRFQCEPFYSAVIYDIRFLLSYPRAVKLGATIFCSALLLMFFYFPDYWKMTLPELSKNIPTGTTENGHPWIGAEKPEIVIEEFSDYMCFQCKKMHYMIRRLIQEYPDKIRLVHRHFPMDSAMNPIVDRTFHQGAAKLAVVSIFAAEKGKFWEMNDILFDISRQENAVNIRNLAEKVGIPSDEIKYLFKNEKLIKKLKDDIQAGLAYGLKGTPGFVIDNNMYVGQIPSNVLSAHLKE